MELVPITLRDANRFVNEHHRHNEQTRGWKFGTSLVVNGEVVAVGIAGRPSGRGLDQYRSVEITRVCVVDGHRNACSKLYGALCRAATALGYTTAYTYTLAEEDAASVKASGFVLDAELGARETWDTPSLRRQDETLFGPRKRPAGAKRRWRRDLVTT